MSAVTLKSHYDDKLVSMNEPCHLPPDTCSLDPVAKNLESSFWQDWCESIRQNLIRAYGGCEPDFLVLTPWRQPAV